MITASPTPPRPINGIQCHYNPSLKTVGPGQSVPPPRATKGIIASVKRRPDRERSPRSPDGGGPLAETARWSSGPPRWTRTTSLPWGKGEVRSAVAQHLRSPSYTPIRTRSRSTSVRRGAPPFRSRLPTGSKHPPRPRTAPRRLISPNVSPPELPSNPEIPQDARRLPSPLRPPPPPGPRAAPELVAVASDPDARPPRRGAFSGPRATEGRMERPATAPNSARWPARAFRPHKHTKALGRPSGSDHYFGPCYHPLTRQHQSTTLGPRGQMAPRAPGLTRRGVRRRGRPARAGFKVESAQEPIDAGPVRAGFPVRLRGTHAYLQGTHVPKQVTPHRPATCLFSPMPAATVKGSGSRPLLRVLPPTSPLL